MNFAKRTVGWINTNSNVLQFTLNLCLVIGLLFNVYQIKESAKSNSITSLNKLYDDNKEIGHAIPEARKALITLRTEFERTDDKNELRRIFGKPEFIEIRKIGHHYEFIGTMVRHELVDFNMVFDIITFPDSFWNESNEVRQKMKMIMPDFWNNFEYLESLYQQQRSIRYQKNEGKVSQ